MKIFLTGLIGTLFGLFLTQTILYPYYMVFIIIVLFLFDVLWAFVSLGQLLWLIYLRIKKSTIDTYTEGAYALIGFGLACLCGFLVVEENSPGLLLGRLENVQSVNGQIFYIYDVSKTMSWPMCRVDLQKGILIQTVVDDDEWCYAGFVTIQVKQGKVLILQKDNDLTERKQEKLPTHQKLDLLLKMPK